MIRLLMFLTGIEDRMPQYILDSLTYDRLLAALLAVSGEAHLSQDTDAFKFALGEIAGIWPETVLASFNERDTPPALLAAA
ncbi:hypothetical protein HJA89_16330 [Rhizobium bangladeshense]|uniref:hypothetical protein n=1 Tax=Rhizobium TaxID=379 RepID=UPI001C84099C|nr:MULTISPECIES: hypothetical protein [Rhizobium]MBX4874442.1 hypothetical protein [Rhizobium bangladeshense]MBX5179434.1 hypothetical protein [Rhizobium lentis]